jgi:DnaJ family protein A protein 5
VPSWATARPADELEEESEEEIEEDHYECVACNKTFKSERQYEAHEKSKKHQKAIQSLKKKMQKDNAHLDLDRDAISSGVITPADDELGLDATESDVDGLDDSVQHLARKADELTVDDDSTLYDEEQEAASKRPTPKDTDSEPQASVEVASDEHDEDEDDEYASRSDIEARLAGFTKKETSTVPPETHDTPPVDDVELENAALPEPKLGKAAQKRAKRAAKQAETEEPDTKNKCAGCDAAFPSKTRLHQHLKDNPKHAALKTVAGSSGKKGKRK